MEHNLDIEKYISDNIDKSFNEAILTYIFENNLDSVYVYNEANLHRRIFSRLYYSNYTPSKNTAICLCLALRFDYDTTLIMLKKLGYTLSKSNKFDLIITYFIVNELYDIFMINDYLEFKGLGILGSFSREDKLKIKKKKVKSSK